MWLATPGALIYASSFLMPPDREPLGHRRRIERLVEAVVGGAEGPQTSRVRALDTRGSRVVVLGGGTGLSTVVGGDSARADWGEHPFLGLKEQFSELDVVVCTTDDGGSTGELLKQLPMIGIGDLRKSCLSLVRSRHLEERYRIDAEAARSTAALLQRVFNTRLDRDVALELTLDPVLAAGPELGQSAPDELREALAWFAGPMESMIDLPGNALGNLILTGAIFRAAGLRTDRAPTLEQVQQGLDDVASVIGCRPGRLHAATAAPGQLKFRYANGVEVYGQKKAGLAQRGCPVERVTAEYAGEPVVSEALLSAIGRADLVIYAPGSVYSSVLPVLQLEPVVEAIRANTSALKILGANFWMQRGETDMALRNQARGFRVSELIEAYNDNIPGGIEGLFEVVLCANLEHVPGNILSEYALEGKRSIYLDRERVERMGLLTVEATLYSPDRLEQTGGIHHDPQRFAAAVRALLAAREDGEPVRSTVRLVSKAEPRSTVVRAPHRPLCDHLAAVRTALDQKVFEPKALRDVLLELAWDNRDIRAEHLGWFVGVRLVAARDWSRGHEYDNVLGYYDPEDRWLKVHEAVLEHPEELRACLLVALGESLLGRYIRERRWTQDPSCGGRVYEIFLRRPQEQGCALSESQLAGYLRLARMIPDPDDSSRFRIGVHADQGFLPPGILFGLLFAWYLNSQYGGVMEYEMSLLRWAPESLLPQHVRERARKQDLVAFFRDQVFGPGFSPPSP